MPRTKKAHPLINAMMEAAATSAKTDKWEKVRRGLLEKD